MNPTATTFFNKHLEAQSKKYDELKDKIQEYKKKHNIHEHTLGDKEYYRLNIEKEETFLDIKRTEAILKGKEFSYIRYHRPLTVRRITELKKFMWDAPEVIQ